jgi:sugar/nucleoside kinase (ribokinase family)/D-arabinose 5-phosphate isomerase GutQ
VSAVPALDVVGIGSVVADRIHRVARLIGPDEKAILRPLASGKPVEIHVGGVVLNHLGWAAALGLRAGVCGKQADDTLGRFLRAAMDRHGIEHRFVLDGSASAFADIYVDDAGGRAIYMAPAATAETTPEFVRRHHADFIRSAAWVTTEVSQLPLATALEVARIAAEAGIRVVVDLDVPPSEAVPGLGSEAELTALLRAAHLLKPSKSAARELAPGAGDDAAAIATALRERFACAAVAVTDGPAGCAIASSERVFVVPAPKARQVIDTTGAGDAFLGGLLFGLSRGLDWSAAARLANACGAACVEQMGAFPEDPAAALARVRGLYRGPELALGEKRGQAPARGAGEAAASGRKAASPPAAAAGAAEASAGRAAPAGAAALAAFDVTLAELSALRGRLDPAAFTRALALVSAARAEGGRIHVTGIGKPEHVASYAASLFASTGTPATFLHGTEVVHGSAGQVVGGDVVIAISNSGETPEMLAAIETVRKLGARIIAVTGDLSSALARAADAVLDARVSREGGGLELAPRASVAAELLVLAALSAALEDECGFTRRDYHARHPSGRLGERSREPEE